MYKCQDVSDNPDLVDWRTEELKQGPNVTIVDFPHNICFLAKNIDENHIVYNIHSSMFPHRKALRLCKSLGGAAPSFEAKSEKLQTNIRYLPSTCKSTCLPIFKSSNLSKLWIGENSEFVQLTNWLPGQPNGGLLEKKCAVIGEDFKYKDEDCENINCFACQVEDFKEFRLKGLCHSGLGYFDHKFVFRSQVLVNGHGLASLPGEGTNAIQFNGMIGEKDGRSMTNGIIWLSLS